MSPRPPPPIPLLRHDLALLAHHDPSTRRLSLHSLKHFISLHLDSLSLPSFVDQLSSLAPRASAPSGNLYAVSLFADVARVHHQAIVPFIPRIMASVVRCISSSSSSSSSSGHGSSLHQACADVVLSLARYAMDPSPAVDSPASPPAEVLRLLCRPLLAPLCSNLEHVAAGAAACLSALVAVDEWNFAGEELAADIHRRCCACLLEKGRVWTGHLRLAKSLAARIPVDAVEMMEHRDSLLRLAAAVLLPETSGAPLPRRRASPWQLRVAAAQLIGTLLPTVFFATAASSDSTPLVSAAASAAASALDACKHDKTPMVRQAVAEAISTMSSDESFVSVSSPDLRRRSVDRLTFRKTKKSLWNGDDSLESTAGIGGANTGFLVHSVESSSESAAAEEVAAASIRSPLYPAKQSPIVDAVPSSVDRHLQRLLLSSSDLKENTPYVPREHSLSLKSEELGYILFNTGAKLSKEIAGDLSTRTSTAAHVGGADDSAPEVEKYADRDAAEDSSLEEKCQADIHGAAVSVESLSERDDDEDPVLELCNSVPAATGDGGGDGLFDGSCRRSASDTDMTGGEMRHIQKADGFLFSTPPKRRRARTATLMATGHKIGKDGDWESLSESGWSVRDNPIAGESEDEEEEEGRWNGGESGGTKAMVEAKARIRDWKSWGDESAVEAGDVKEEEDGRKEEERRRRWRLPWMGGLMVAAAAVVVAAAALYGGEDGDALVPT